MIDLVDVHTLPQVSAMEADVLGGQSMQESLKNSQAKMDIAVRDIYLSLTAASGRKNIYSSSLESHNLIYISL